MRIRFDPSFGIGNIDAHASDGNAVAGQTVEVWVAADVFKILVAAGVISENKINRYESNNEIKNKKQQ